MYGVPREAVRFSRSFETFDGEQSRSSVTL